VGTGGIILHYNGRAWSQMNSATTVSLYEVWGNSMGNVFAVGENGAILHYDGARWAMLDSPSRNDLYTIWGAGADIFAAGRYGTILRYSHR
jgi:hypothetical protein